MELMGYFSPCRGAGSIVSLLASPRSPTGCRLGTLTTARVSLLRTAEVETARGIASAEDRMRVGREARRSRLSAGVRAFMVPQLRGSCSIRRRDDLDEVQCEPKHGS